MSYKEGGWKQKYVIKKIERYLDWSDRDGGNWCERLVDPDPEAHYFVLRFDTDPHARKALETYANSVEVDNPEFAADIRQKLSEIPLKERQ